MSDEKKSPETVAHLRPEAPQEPTSGCRMQPLPAASPPPEPLAGGAGQKPPLVYTLGLIKFDFGTDARHDAFVQAGLANPHDARQLLAHLADPEHQYDVLGLTWTLTQEDTAIYAIQPAGAFAADTHRRLRECVREQIEEGVTQISIPGRLTGTTRLMNGHEVPVISPDIRGMYSWSTPALIDAVLRPSPTATDAEKETYRQHQEEISNFLDHVYYDLRNLGLSPQERALNFAATNLYQVSEVYREAIKHKLRLDKIEVERSAISRPNSECWDVKLTLFDPKQRQERARDVYRLTVDVSEVIPVTIGKLRHWSTY